LRNSRLSEPKSDEEEWFMKTRILIVFAVVALVVAFAYTAPTPAAAHKANANAVPTAAPQPKTATATAAEPHPEIREAIGALRRAKEHMEHAAHDFGGHRVEAIRATDVAIHQLEDCLKYDRD
jgi:hypothetical protein